MWVSIEGKQDASTLRMVAWLARSRAASTGCGDGMPVDRVGHDQSLLVLASDLERIAAAIDQRGDDPSW
ncbi:hypothetical protein [Sphingomonas phyllosphaerae]|uniref:hypothetical protein n=1 Tax=Sphingomonas phyllosphaerae TaxID=257003 RepID=UPI0024137A8C|nr:hypothetical protein [Sphingomonas phyllosphaerae]